MSQNHKDDDAAKSGDCNNNSRSATRVSSFSAKAVLPLRFASFV